MFVVAGWVSGGPKKKTVRMDASLIASIPGEDSNPHQTSYDKVKDVLTLMPVSGS